MARLLVIDDDQNYRTALKSVLKHAGHTVAIASDGKEGLALLAEQACDMVITDILMPGMEGTETIAHMRRLYPEMRIIAISGGGKLAAMDYLRLATAFGADRAMEKPVTKAQLLDAVDALASPPPA